MRKVICSELMSMHLSISDEIYNLYQYDLRYPADGILYVPMDFEDHGKVDPKRSTWGLCRHLGFFRAGGEKLLKIIKNHWKFMQKWLHMPSAALGRQNRAGPAKLPITGIVVVFGRRHF